MSPWASLNGGRSGAAGTHLKYRHSYHAGNVGDVLKHVVLVGILRRLAAKPGAFYFLDTHAGRGVYELAGAGAGERSESAAGILQLSAVNPPVESLADYLQLVRTHANAADPATTLRSYPGSGRLAQLLMRPQDRAVLCEIERAEVSALRAAIGRDRRFRIVRADGYAAIRAELPPTPRRGLVLIDPPYESQQGEFALRGARTGRGSSALGDGRVCDLVPDQAARAGGELSRPPSSERRAPHPVRRAESLSAGLARQHERLRHDHRQPAVSARERAARGLAGVAFSTRGQAGHERQLLLASAGMTLTS